MKKVKKKHAPHPIWVRIPWAGKSYRFNMYSFSLKEMRRIHKWFGRGIEARRREFLENK